MIRITDQYWWNFIFSSFFAVLVVMGIIILDGEAYKAYDELLPVDLVLITLATWRLIRLFVYDAITKFIREQFWDVVEKRNKIVLVKPERGPRRTLADLMGCPWCLGVWLGALVTFFYLLTPYAYFPILFLALSAVATYLQLLANLTGHAAEKIRRENES